MKSNQADITVEIDSDLLEKIRIIAGRRGISAEQYISDIVNHHVLRLFRRERQEEDPGDSSTPPCGLRSE